MASASKMQKKSLDSSPDEIRTFEKGKIDLANLGDVTIGRGILEPDFLVALEFLRNFFSYYMLVAIMAPINAIYLALYRIRTFLSSSGSSKLC